MGGHSRYSLSAKEAGMDDGILENKFGIKNQMTLEDAETLLLSDAYKHFFESRPCVFTIGCVNRRNGFAFGTIVDSHCLYMVFGKSASFFFCIPE